jgi:hypothetical protein
MTETPTARAASGTKSQRLRRQTMIALVFVLVAAILFESWQAAAAAAATGGRPHPLLWPVTLEGFLCLLVLVYWEARSQGRRVWMVRLTAWLVTVAAAVVQILDAPQSWLGWTTAGLTPLMLLWSVEFAVWLLYGATARASGGERGATGDLAPGQKVAGAPAALAGSGADQPSGPSRPGWLAPGAPPPQTTHAAVGPVGAEDGSLSDPAPTVTTPTVTEPSQSVATPWKPTPRVDEALRRRKKDREALETYIAEKGLPHAEVMALAARRGWPAANGHKETVPA